MENLLKEYEKSLKIIKDKIKQLKSELKEERSPHKVYTLRHAIESYNQIKGDLYYSINEIKSYLNARTG